MTPEFSRLVDIRQINSAEQVFSANEAERAALARRFSLVSVDKLEATVTLAVDSDIVTASGRFAAKWVQPCAISGEDLPQQAQELLTLRFIPAAQAQQGGEEEIELSDEDCDEIEYSGHSFDIGEAIAQTLALAIDPFAAGPDADRARKAAGIVTEDAAGPFAALAGLKLPKE